MALRLQKRKYTKSDGTISESWRLILREYKAGQEVDTYPPRKDYRAYGLNEDDSYEQAKVKLNQVRATGSLNQDFKRISRIKAKLQMDLNKEGAFLPKSVYADFLTWLQKKRTWDRVPDKTVSHLACMRKLILELDTHPTKLCDDPGEVYIWFRKNKLSLSYIQKVLPLLNDYCYYYCMVFDKRCQKIPAPRGDQARRIEDANLDDRDGSQAASLPIPPSLIKDLELPQPQINWMRLSVYFGLRPSEVDELKIINKGKVWKITKDKRGTFILHFYQRKLIKIDRERRWKRIPCIVPEQVELIKEIDQGIELKRPILKTLHARLGDGYGLYGGRKGFEKFMREKGQAGANISRWLGHQDINRTEMNYRELEAVEYTVYPDRRS